MGKVVIGVVVATIAIIGIAAFVLNQPQTSQTSQNQTQTTPTSSAAIPTIDPNQKLQITDVKEGTGSAVKVGDTVVMNYKGTLTNGKQFDSSYDRGQPFTTKIGVGQVIKGWDQGVPGMKVGGKRKLVIPASLGYGATGAPPDIPPNATLIFEVELVQIK